MTDTFSSNAKKVLEKRYLKEDKNTGKPETIDALFRRVSDNIAEADKFYDKNADVRKVSDIFYNMMVQRRFMPNSPTLMNAGRELQQLSACFVLPVGDSIEEIFESIKHAALIHKSGGGTGFSFSNLRPKNDVVKTTSGISSGPVSFMKAFNVATEVIKQGGTRRGANMGILRVDHPDILEFISSKNNNDELNNFNISVAITDDFMNALYVKGDYKLFNPRTKKEQGSLNSNDVFDLIVNAAWKNGEPGIVFIDVINKDNPTPEIGKIESTNPCGEQPLLPYEACNLGSINLALFVKDSASSRNDEDIKEYLAKKIDYDLLKQTVHESVHFLDNVIDMNNYPLPEIDKLVRSNRKIGLGVMGFADMLFMLSVAYNSKDGEYVAENIMSFIDNESKNASMNLAKQRGKFENCDKSIYKHKGIEIRNATTTTIAPTGTISIIADCSSGIEPIFALAFTRNVMDNDELPEVNPIFEEIAKREGFYTKELMKEIAKKGSIKHTDGVPEKWKKVFVVSHDIEPEWHIRIQAAFQKYTDNAVSKTINFSNSATKEHIKDAYLLSYKLGCKGVTVYRDGSRDSQVLTVGSEKKTSSDSEKTEENTGFETITPRERPRVTTGQTIKIGTACGKLYVTVNEDEYGLCEIFATIGKSGGCAYSQTEGISRLLSLSLRSGVEVEAIVRQLRGIRCTSPIWEDGEMILSCPDAIGKAIEIYLQNRTDVKPINHVKINMTQSKTGNSIGVRSTGEICPECSSTLQMSEGCMTCHNCGYSKCS